VKTRPASASRPSLPYRTSKLFLASLFQGVATGMNDSSFLAIKARKKAKTFFRALII
jgi:hypothetical protein